MFLFGIRGGLSTSYTAGGGQLVRNGHIGRFARIAIGFSPPRLRTKVLIISNLFNDKLGGPLTNKFTTVIGCVGRDTTGVIDVSLPSNLVDRSGSCGVDTGVVHTSLALALRRGGLSVVVTSGRRCLNEVGILSVQLSPRFVRHARDHYDVLRRGSVHRLLGPHNSFTRGNDVNATLLVTNDCNVSNTSILTAETYLEANIKGIVARAPGEGCRVVRVSIPRTMLRVSARRAVFDRPMSARSCRTVNVNPKLKADRTATVTLVTRLEEYAYPIIISTSTLGVLTDRHT